MDALKYNIGITFDSNYQKNNIVSFSISIKKHEQRMTYQNIRHITNYIELMMSKMLRHKKSFVRWKKKESPIVYEIKTTRKLNSALRETGFQLFSFVFASGTLFERFNC